MENQAMKKSIFNLILILFCCFGKSVFCYGQQTFSEHFFKAKKAFNRSDFENATMHYQNAIEVFNDSDDSIQLGESYLRVGMIYGKLKNYPSSLEYTTQAKIIFQDLKNDSMLIITYNILGNLYAVNRQYNEALRTYSISLKLAVAENLIDRQGSILNNIGVLYYYQKKYYKAIHYYEKSLQIAIQMKSKYGMSVSLINIGKCYNDLGNSTKAISYIKAGIEKARDINDLYQLQIGYEQLSKSYAKSHNYKEAHNYLNLFMELKDSIGSVEIYKQIAAQEAKFQSQKKELEIINLKAEKQKNEIVTLESNNKIVWLKYGLSFIIVIALLMIYVAYLNFKQYKNKLSLSIHLTQSKNELERKNNELNTSLHLNKKLQSALKQDLENYKQLAYRKQMNPHFIFNSLNAIQNYVLTNDKLSANFYLGELSTLIRRILENSEKDLIPLAEELFVCETYIKLEQKRFENKFEYIIEMDESIDGIIIPPLLLQPFVENAIWHGLLHKESGGLLCIHVLRENDTKAVISIRDNGVGRANREAKNQSAVKQESLGINLTMKRIAINNFLIDDTISLVIHDLKDEITKKSNGTEVVITINKKAHEQQQS